VASGGVEVNLACTGASCAGTASVYGRVVVKLHVIVRNKRGKKHRRTVRRHEVLELGSVNFSLAAGAQLNEQIPLNKIGSKALAKAAPGHRLRLQLRVKMGKAVRDLAFKVA
jgi:hypothetical protein